MDMTNIKILCYIVIFVILALVLIYSIFVEPFRIETVSTDIRNSRIPEQFKDTRIVFISDIHNAFFFSTSRIDKIVDSINALEPDIILLGGDYINQNRNRIAPCFDALRRLNAPMGKYGVLGNHDCDVDAALTRQCMADAGIICLDNSSVWLTKDNARIKLGGVGDFQFQSQLLDNTTGDTTKDDFIMLLSHSPDFVENMAFTNASPKARSISHSKLRAKPGTVSDRNANTHVDLMLSGHTHGGAVTFFGLWAPLVTSIYGDKYKSGLYQLPQTTLLVSNGLGYAGSVPARFFAPPQINVITLK